MEPGNDDPDVPAATEEEAKAKVEFEVPTAIIEADINQDNYKALFQKKATEVSDGVWKVEFELTDAAKTAEQTKVNTAATTVLNVVKDTTGKVDGQMVEPEVTGATPGFYYAIGSKRLDVTVYDNKGGSEVVKSAWVVTDRKMAGADGKVKFEVPYYSNGQVYEVTSEVTDTNGEFTE